jgi:hypothetical protein
VLTLEKALPSPSPKLSALKTQQHHHYPSKAHQQAFQSLNQHSICPSQTRYRTQFHSAASFDIIALWELLNYPAPKNRHPHFRG